MKVKRIYTDNRGSFIEVAEIVSIEEIEKKFEAEGVEYDTWEEADAALQSKKAKVEVAPQPTVEDTIPATQVIESTTKQFDIVEKDKSLWNTIVNMIGI